MDPQKLSQLDPKLKEAYMRVMGTSVPQPQAPSVKTQAPPPPPAAFDAAPVGGSIPIPDPTPAPQPPPLPFPTPPPAIEEPPTQPTEPPVQPPTSEPQSISTPQPTIPQPQPPTPEPAIPTPPTQTENFDQMNSEVAAAPSQNFTAPMPAAPTIAVKKNNHLMPIAIGLAGLIFVAIYILFWTKIFNFKLPFLP